MILTIQLIQTLKRKEGLLGMLNMILTILNVIYLVGISRLLGMLNMILTILKECLGTAYPVC